MNTIKGIYLVNFNHRLEQADRKACNLIEYKEFIADVLEQFYLR